MPWKPIDPFARKMILASFMYGAVLLVMFGILTVVYLHNRPTCNDRVVEESTDPSKQWTATVMERRCGVEAPFLTHVNLAPAGQSLKTGFFSGMAQDGQIFTVELDAASTALTLNWISPKTLHIQCTHCNLTLIQKRDEHMGDIAIQYDLPSH
jgi:hypothetical protein